MASFIVDYKEYHTDTTVRFVVTMTPEKLREAQIKVCIKYLNYKHQFLLPVWFCLIA